MSQPRSSNDVLSDKQQLDRQIGDELQFLRVWENGEIPELSSYLRVRQIRRANLVSETDPVVKASGVERF
jgi:hypothetical protein